RHNHGMCACRWCYECLAPRARTEHRGPSKAGISAPTSTLRSPDLGGQNQSASSSALADKYGRVANSPAVAAAIRNAQASGITTAGAGAKAAADRYEALEHGHPLPGTDPMQLIMHGYVPPGMPPQQAAMLYNSLPNNLKMPHVPEPGTPEWIALMSHEPIDPETGVPFSLKEQQVQAANQQMFERYMREEHGPIYIPPLHANHAWPLQPARKTADGFLADKTNQLSTVPVDYRHGSVNDHQGSITEMTDQNGNIIRQYSYDPWGHQTVRQGSGPDADFGYAGMYKHPPSGLNLPR